MLAERVQGNIMQNVKITPSEVRAFYAGIPQDSLPFFPATVEIGADHHRPAYLPRARYLCPPEDCSHPSARHHWRRILRACGRLRKLRPGSRDNGGDLGTVSRNDLVPEFSAAAWRLQPGEISNIVKTKFGYHIIQMVQRQGDNAHLRHILIPIQRSSADYRAALKKLDSVRSLLVAGYHDLPQAVGKFSTDDQSKLTGGMMTDPQTGSTRLPIESLDAATALMLDSLQPGVYSQPQMFTAPTGEKSTRIVWMKGRTEPHKANLTDDYNRLQEVALAQKKNKKLEAWLAEKLPTYYVRLAPEYQGCKEMSQWQISPN
jgi:peptidyl-prolyl cis-trans isomerase SurA